MTIQSLGWLVLVPAFVVAGCFDTTFRGDPLELFDLVLHHPEFAWNDTTQVLSGRFVVSNIGPVPLRLEPLWLEATYYRASGAQHDLRKVIGYEYGWEILPGQHVLYRFGLPPTFRNGNATAAEAHLWLHYDFDANPQGRPEIVFNVEYHNECVALAVEGAQIRRDNGSCNPFFGTHQSNLQPRGGFEPGPRKYYSDVRGAWLPPVDVWNEWNLSADASYDVFRPALEFVQGYQPGNEIPYAGTTHGPVYPMVDYVDRTRRGLSRGRSGDTPAWNAEQGFPVAGVCAPPRAPVGRREGRAP